MFNSAATRERERGGGGERDSTPSYRSNFPMNVLGNFERCIVRGPEEQRCPTDIAYTHLIQVTLFRDPSARYRRARIVYPTKRATRDR